MRGRLLVVGCLLLIGTGLDVTPAFGRHENLSALLPGNPLEGSRLFTGKGCLRCHAVHGVGGTSGPDLGRGMLNRPLLEIAGVMWNHSPGMEHLFQEERVTRPKFEPPEMASLLAFLYYLGSFDPPGDVAAGARLFRDKGCRTCHSLGGQGGSAGPPLDRYSRYASPLALTTALWNRGRAMAGRMEEMRVSRATFEGNDIPNLLAFIRSTDGGTEHVYAAPGNPKRGEDLFTKKRCVECHSIRGHGGSIGPDLGIKLKGSLTQITGAMWNHAPYMWVKMAERGMAVPSLDMVEMGDLIAYLYFFQFIDPPGDARRGRAVYEEKQCGLCHGSAKAGQLVAPPLAGVVAKLPTPLEIITQMWNHAGRMEERMTEVNVAWPLLKGGEMADLIAYLLRDQGAVSRPANPKGSAPKRDRGQPAR